ncbi:MAG TPA: response regulator [Verrucomicrobiota bacterium]|nr:response regulator [Verrucomicrobiota bacterium]HQL80095.1 response regulator [Verrucomicrobiota bacterium]
MKGFDMRKRRILVVDDQPMVCDALKMMLDLDGHEVKAVFSGEDALATLQQEQFDLVITDFEMPTMKGDELAASIKARSPKQPVVMITAYAEMFQASPNTVAGVDFILNKPFRLENLRDAVAKASPEGPNGEATAN